MRYIKNKIKQNKLLLTFLRRVYSLFKTVPLEPIQKVIDKYRKTQGKLYFIQIGSNDGKNGDPLYRFIKKYDWKGILIEPVPYLFEQLMHNYKSNKNLAFENIAISDQNGSSKFYRLKRAADQHLPFWYDQLGSFKKEVILKHKDSIPNIEDLLIDEEVKVLTFNALIDKYKLSKVNILHIDTEGYDYEIIKKINFDKVTIDVVLFEHKHLTSSDYSHCVNLFISNGYTTFKFLSDTLCINKEFKEVIAFASIEKKT